jgi:lipopolysaccharide biosynthesis glycosyltransferase
MVMPDAFISLLIDDNTEKTLVGKRMAIHDLVNEEKVIQIESMWNKKERSRWLKTSARMHIEGDFLYIDCDTVIADDLRNISELDIELGAVMDCHTSWNNNLPFYLRDSREKRLNWDKMLGFKSMLKTSRHFNSGVIYSRDTPNNHHFFEKWHELWLYSHTVTILDQIPFSQADYLFNGCITELEGTWNCQIYAEGMLRYLSNARIIHFWGGGSSDDDSCYELASPILFAKIKENGYVTDDIRNLLRSPETAFSEKAKVFLMNKKNNFFYSPTCSFFKQLYHIKLISWFDMPLKQLLRFCSGIYKYFHKKAFIHDSAT